MIDEFPDSLFRDSINIDSFLADETGKFLKLFGWAGCIGAMERFGATLALAHYGWRMADRTFVWNDKGSHHIGNIDYLRDNFVGLDYLQSGSLVANAQTLTFANIAE